MDLLFKINSELPYQYNFNKAIHKHNIEGDYPCGAAGE